jgi:8-oxo-dGTP pyrophosphatase MutT (NUDIX family)
MDLTIPLENVTLNIRVAALVKGARGYILEKHKDGFYFPVGGRVKTGETSIEAVKRELIEEIGVSCDDPKLSAIAELFFGSETNRRQEICFVYTIEDLGVLDLGDEFVEFTRDEIQAIDFRPRILKEVLTSDQTSVLHLVSRD